MTGNFESENSEVEKLGIVKFDIVMIEAVKSLATDTTVVACFETENLETEFPDLGSKNSRRAQPHLDYY